MKHANALALIAGMLMHQDAVAWKPKNITPQRRPEPELTQEEKDRIAAKKQAKYARKKQRKKNRR